MSSLAIFVYGFLGGICPSLLKIAATLAVTPIQPLLIAVAVTIILGIVGGIIAIASNEQSVKAAIFAGIAAPGLIASAASGAAINNASANGDKASLSWFSVVSPAEAQAIQPSAPSSSLGDLKAIEIRPELVGGRPTWLNLPVSVPSNGTSNPSVRVGNVTDANAPLVVFVPADAEALQIGGETVPLTVDTKAIDLKVTTAPTVKGDLWWALGANRTFDVQKLTAEPTK